MSYKNFSLRIGYSLTLIIFTTIIVSSSALAGSQITDVQSSLSIYLPIVISTSAQPDEAILIIEPGTGSRLTSPLHLSGIADPTFEQNLGIQIILLDGTVLTTTSTIIQADAGQRGPFSIDIPFTVVGEQQASIQVFSTSARDGEITHLSSVFAILADSGLPSINLVSEPDEQISIYKPTPNELISGGVAHIEGFGLASFEQQLFVEILDAGGTVIGSASVIVNAPDIGLPGSFSADIPYTLVNASPGRIVIHDPSPAFDGDIHLVSVEIHLEP